MDYEPKIVIFSGAGLSAESGIATFRDADGLWEGHDIMEVCSIRTFPDNYGKVHDFYNQRRKELGNVSPNKAHKIIAKWQKKWGKERVVNITANVDDLLERAGVEDVIHVHGNLTEMIFDYSESSYTIKDIGYTEYNYKEDDYRGCSMVTDWVLSAKPNVVFFGEAAPLYKDMYKVLENLHPKDIFIIVGTTLEVNPVHVFFDLVERNYLINPDKNPSKGSNLLDAKNITTSDVQETASKGLMLIEEEVEELMSKKNY